MNFHVFLLFKEDIKIQSYIIHYMRTLVIPYSRVTSGGTLCIYFYTYSTHGWCIQKQKYNVYLVFIRRCLPHIIENSLDGWLTAGCLADSVRFGLVGWFFCLVSWWGGWVVSQLHNIRPFVRSSSLLSYIVLLPFILSSFRHSINSSIPTVHQLFNPSLPRHLKWEIKREKQEHYVRVHRNWRSSMKNNKKKQKIILNVKK